MISVIVPIYKVEPYLRQCVDSILNQSYRNLEVLLIDDGSPDKCGEICDEYERRDERVRVFHTENRGLSAARNLGLREAKGDYIGFVDSDDWIEPDMYEVLLKRIEETGADIGVCGIACEYVNRCIDFPCSEAIYDSNNAVHALICGDLRNQVMNKLWTRKVATFFQFPEEHVYEDIFTVYKVFLRAEKVATVRKALYRYRQRKGSIAQTYPMQNLIDYWDAIHQRCEALKIRCADGEVLELEKQCASAIARTWRWFNGVSKSQRNYHFLDELNSFTIQNYPLLGKKEWPLSLRIYILLAHYNNAVSLKFAYVLNYMLWSIEFSNALWA